MWKFPLEGCCDRNRDCLAEHWQILDYWNRWCSRWSVDATILNHTWHINTRCLRSPVFWCQRLLLVSINSSSIINVATSFWLLNHCWRGGVMLGAWLVRVVQTGDGDIWWWVGQRYPLSAQGDVKRWKQGETQAASRSGQWPWHISMHCCFSMTLHEYDSGCHLAVCSSVSLQPQADTSTYTF